MEITDVELHPVATRRRTDAVSHHVIILLRTDTEITGLGEVSDLSHVPAIMPDLVDLESYLNQQLRGLEPVDVTHVEEAMDESFPYAGPPKRVKTGVEIACYDAAAKMLDLPLYRFLGGAKRERIPISYPVFRIENVAEVPRRLDRVEMALDNGFDAIRYYFGADLDADRLFLEGIQEQFGERITVKSLDASGRFTWKEAIAAYDRLKQFDFVHLESPVPRGIREERADVDGLSRVTDRIDRPVSEHVTSIPHALKLLQRKAADIWNVSLVQAGGIRNARRVHDLAATFDIACLVGTTQELSIGTAAQAHVAAAARCQIRRSDPVGPFLYRSDVVEERVQYEGGHLVIPDGPGLGVEIDETKLTEQRRPLSMLDE